MNERIQELAEQAGVLKEYSFVRGATVWKIDSSIEKFAELIVQECTRIFEECRYDPFPFDEDYAILLLKTHFGVNNAPK